MTRYEARARLTRIRNMLRSNRASLFGLGETLGMTTEQVAKSLPASQYKLDIEAIDECERALETLGD